jgi:hypothetical protein
LGETVDWLFADAFVSLVDAEQLVQNDDHCFDPFDHDESMYDLRNEFFVVLGSILHAFVY